MTAPKPENAKVAEATAKLKDAQRALVDRRRQLLDGKLIEIAVVERLLAVLAQRTQAMILGLPPKIIRELKRIHPELFADLKIAAATEESIAQLIDEVLTVFSNHKPTFKAEEPTVIAGTPRARPTGRPRRKLKADAR